MFSSFNACFMLRRTLMAYFVLSPNGEESLNKFIIPDSDPDPDQLRGAPSYGYNTSESSGVKISSFKIGARVRSVTTERLVSRVSLRTGE